MTGGKISKVQVDACQERAAELNFEDTVLIVCAAIRGRRGKERKREKGRGER